MGHDVMSAAVELMFIVYMHVLIYLSVAWGIFYVYININSIHEIFMQYVLIPILLSAHYHDHYDGIK
jgi:hypothetical protein